MDLSNLRLKICSILLLEDLQSLALIGYRNAGKTTCLNHIIAAWIATGQSGRLPYLNWS